MRRVLVIGSGGAGKSTLAAQLGTRPELPVVHLDACHWHPGWVPTPDAEWHDTVARLAAGDAWVMDGNYGGTLDLRLAACDAVIFLDLPRWLCIARVLGRWLRYSGRTPARHRAGLPRAAQWGVPDVGVGLPAPAAPRHPPPDGGAAARPANVRAPLPEGRRAVPHRATARSRVTPQ